MTTLTYEQCLNMIETGMTIPTISFIETHNISYNDCLCASLGMLLAGSMDECLWILRRVNQAGLNSFSQAFQDKMYSDDLLCHVDGKWCINANHIVWKDSGMDEEELVYQGPVVE